MADHRTEEAVGLTHRSGRRQPSEDIDEQFDQEVHEVGADVDRSAQLTSTSRPMDEAGTSQSAQEVGRGRSKGRAWRQNVRGRRGRQPAGDPVEGGEALARPITPFDVDTHGSRMTEYELALIRRYFHVSDYVQFRLPGLADVPTRPPLGSVAVYRDYFVRGLRLPLHPFIREVLVNLEISLPQLNPNAYQCMVALWALYRVLGFLDLMVEEL